MCRSTIRAHFGRCPSIMAACVRQVCETCGKSYKNAMILKRHQKLHDGTAYMCTMCEKQFIQSYYLAEHMNLHTGRMQHSYAQRIYVCARALLFILAAHFCYERAYKCTGARPFACDQCDAAYASKPGLISHTNDVHEDHRNYKCDLCEKAFNYRHQFVYHRRSKHTGERPFTCDRCDKTYIMITT